MKHLVRLARKGTPEVTRPEPQRVIAGDPVHTTWSLEERPAGSAEGPMLYAGLWHTTPGEWRVDFTEWEYVHIVEGLSILVDEAGQETRLAAGDSYVIRPGFRGSWRCVEPTLKDYVIVG